MQLIISGESHGPGYVGILTGLPAGFIIEEELIIHELAKRRQALGRSSRQKLEDDQLEIISGQLDGKTTGGPLGLVIKNRARNSREMKIPRPGHVDLAGYYKYGGLQGMVWASERASARETVIRVAAGAILKQFLKYFNITIGGWVENIGKISLPRMDKLPTQTQEQAAKNPLYCPDPETSRLMLKALSEAEECGETLGGIFNLTALGVPAGLGETGNWEKRMDARIAQALMSIPGVKGVEIGHGFALASLTGSEAQDEIEPKKGITHKTNRAGGLEGGLSNGEAILARVAVKPIPTNNKGLASIDLTDQKPAPAPYYRSDTCAVPAALTIGQAMLALVITENLRKKFGGDTIEEMLSHYHSYLERF